MFLSTSPRNQHFWHLLMLLPIFSSKVALSWCFSAFLHEELVRALSRVWKWVLQQAIGCSAVLGAFFLVTIWQFHFSTFCFNCSNCASFSSNCVSNAMLKLASFWNVSGSAFSLRVVALKFLWQWCISAFALLSCSLRASMKHSLKLGHSFWSSVTRCHSQ